MSEQMKPSGIDWIGDIPIDWEIGKVRFVTALRGEKGFYTEKDKYIGLENISSYTGEYLSSETEYDSGIYDVYKKGDLLFNKLRPYLAKALIANDDGFCTGELEVISEYKGDKRYLFYYLLSDGFLKMVDASTYGTKMPRANWDYIKNFSIPLLPSKEQQAIADYLDKQCNKIDGIISDLETQIDTLQCYKKSLILETVTKGLNKKAPMKPSGIDWIGDIPKHWEVKRLKYILSLSSGDAITNEQLEDGDFPVFGGGKQMGLYNRCNVKKDTILIGRVGANCGCITKTESNAWATDNALIVNTKNDLTYIFYVLEALELNRLNDANAQPLITSTKVGNCLAAFIHNIKEQKRIADYLDGHCIKIDAILQDKQAQLETIKQHKKSLIYEYVTGKKRVKEKHNGN